MKTSLVLYHGNCSDGFGAAFAAWLSLGETADYLACTYDRHLVPDVTDRDVYILDFSFLPDVLDAMAKKAKSITLLDHHVTAQRALGNYKLFCCGKIHFDMQQSGAMLAWKHFHPEKPVPALIRNIQDRDLWLWKEPKSAEFLAWLDAQPIDFETWNRVCNFTSEELEHANLSGTAMLAKFKSQCETIVNNASPVCISGIKGLMVNASHFFTSEVGLSLANLSGTFGLIWRVGPTGSIDCSLRSHAPFDVEVLASNYGGGGHSQASAFRLDKSSIGNLLNGDL